MEQWIEALFTKDLLNEAASRYNADATEAKKLGDFENYVFEVYKNDQPYILRLTHSSHRNMADVEAELEWINYLHAKAINVSLVHQSKNGSLVEEIPVGNTSFFVCLFDKAPGNPVKIDDPLFGPKLFEKWGQITGGMHRVTKDYQPGDHKREHWEEDDVLDFGLYLDKEKDAKIIADGEEVVRVIKGLPVTKESFGLIHSDIHPGNFFLDGNEIHVFDFDDSAYFYYMSDIAIPLYYAVWWKCRNEILEDRSEFGKELLYHFLKGYQKVNKIDPEWIYRIPLFLQLRDYVLYAVFHKKVDMENASDNTQQLVAQIRDRLLRNEPMVELQYGEVLERLKG
ncbi:phosphotransferase enzyme family protein [Jeotgalibacillus soli]|uniref:Aminoglycoside phosphotransferase domain-containing protein n=1 Tax=Jeotgalibacillus soli TaxID=889306 RepID=A0A0C2VSA9_9BACL|nr:phosphotransferase [Jeotgalibacillus soli]KIL51812.1 hypothetical protein KP78_01820 [Jeotgalibacillus soli]